MFKLYFLNEWNNFEGSPCPWEVVKLSITHKEGHVAKASLTVVKFSPAKSTYLAIFENDTLLFKGRLSGQFTHHNELTTVDVLNVSPNFESELSNLLKNGGLEYDSRFFQGKEPKACDYLEACNSLFYWKRTSGEIGLSNYFKGTRCVDIGGNYIQGSLKTNQINMPLGKVMVNLKVVWMQSLGGVFNAAPYIAKGFANGVIATLTPQAITSYWPRTDQRLGMGNRQSGYRVERSNIASVASVQTVGGRLATYTKPFCEKTGDGEKTMRCKIHYFKAELRINWQYQQVREEHLVLQGFLNHEQHKFSNHKVRMIPITVNLPISEQAIFFETKIGRDFITYAGKIANSQLVASARCMRVVCKLPWELGRDLTVDDSLRLNTPHLAQHLAQSSITGKITQVSLVVKGLQRFVEVTLGCVIAKGDLQESAVETLEDEVFSNDPLMGITYPKLNPKDLIEGVCIKNAAQEQENYLMLNQFPVRDNLSPVLAEAPTSIHLNMRNLRTEKILKRNFAINLALAEPPTNY